MSDAHRESRRVWMQWLNATKDQRPKPPPRQPKVPKVDPYIAAAGDDPVERHRRVRQRNKQSKIDARKRRLRRQNPKPKYIPPRKRRYGRSVLDRRPVEHTGGLVVNDHRSRTTLRARDGARWPTTPNHAHLAQIARYGPYMAAHLLSLKELACPRNVLGRWLPHDHTPDDIKPRPRSTWRQASIVPVALAEQLAAQRRAISNLDLPRCVGCITDACGPDRPHG